MSNKRQNTQTGFTLIELLITMIILGVLAAIALPNLLKQVEKGRQSEAKTTLGAINRAQQAYRFEKATFTVLDKLPINPPKGLYYIFSDDGDGTADAVGAKQKAEARDEYKNDILNYASAVGQTTPGSFQAIVCEDEEPTQDDVTTINSSGNVDCSNGVKIY